jgi:hypothetical protein
LFGGDRVYLLASIGGSSAANVGPNADITSA